MRLIDADAFIEYLGLDVEDAREENLGEIVTLEDFDRQPTAFDVEKVVEELKDATQYVKYHGVETETRAIHPVQAIEIVRAGGVE